MDPSVLSDNKIIQLEKQFETNVESGLITTEAEKRLSRKESQYKTKEKKRLWHVSIIQECQDPLFFFQIYLCSFFLLAGEKCWIISLLTFFTTAALKGRQILWNYRCLLQQTEKKIQKALVLRDGIYRRMNVRNIVTGDILRIKRGEKVPVSVWSIQNPENKYWEGEIFQEESGKVIACGTTALQKNDGNCSEKSKEWKEKEQIMRERKETMDVLEGNILYGLCGFSFLFLVYGCLSGQAESFQWLYLTATLVSGGLAFVKEIIGIQVSSLN